MRGSDQIRSNEFESFRPSQCQKLAVGNTQMSKQSGTGHRSPVTLFAMLFLPDTPIATVGPRLPVYMRGDWLALLRTPSVGLVSHG